MTKAWITTSSTHIQAITNSINAACNQGYIPDRVFMLENPSVIEEVDEALSITKDIVVAHGGVQPETHVKSIEEELAFEEILNYVRNAIEEVRADDGEVAVDITPGRKYMSAIAFTAGMKYNADHVFYFYLTGLHYGKYYPEIPRTASDLIDFTEVLA